MNLVNVLWIIIIVIALAYGLHWLIHWIYRKRSAELVTSADLQDVIRKVQLIDVREVPEYNARHILGARNIPGSEFKLRVNEIRKDIPVYLYSDNLAGPSRAANRLRKEGFSQVYILEEGIEGWYGSTKSKIKH